MKKLLTLLMIVLAGLAAVAAQESSTQGTLLYNPYERPKNGPPLTNVIHKVELSWLQAKLADPQHHPAARMPDFKFTEEEVLDVMAYLKSIAKPLEPKVRWPAWADQGFEEMNDEGLEEMFELVDLGQAVWGDARCTICHSVNGPGGELIGGFVDLRVGGIDLQIAATKLKRDWLYAWIEDPKNYFPDTLMPRYRFSDDEIKALVEYILREDAFLSSEEETAEEPGDWSMLDEPGRADRGKDLIQLSRCVVCHDIQGIPEVFSPSKLIPPASARNFEFLAYDLRCLSCHSIQGRGGTYAPDLTSEGSRLQENWIAQFVESPDMVRPLSQQMPKFNITEEEAELIASYIKSERRDTRIPAEIPGGAVTPGEIQQGRQVFQNKGCFSCHTVEEGEGGVVGPELAAVGERLSTGYLWFHLKNPHDLNPYSAEPDFMLTDEEARALAAYLARRKQ